MGWIPKRPSSGPHGNFYVTTLAGGQFDHGTIFRVDPSTGRSMSGLKNPERCFDVVEFDRRGDDFGLEVFDLPGWFPALGDQGGYDVRECLFRMGIFRLLIERKYAPAQNRAVRRHSALGVCPQQDEEKLARIVRVFRG